MQQTQSKHFLHLDNGMPLLEWIEQTPNAHLIGECFESQVDLMGAQDRLGSRAHLLPMSDAALFNVAIGFTLNGDCPVVEWPTTDISTLSSTIQTLPDSGIGSMIIRVHCQGNTLDWTSLKHPAVEVWSPTSSDMQTTLCQRAQTQKRIIVLLESAAALAWHKLEGHQPSGVESTTIHGSHPAHCLVLSSSIVADVVQDAIDLCEDVAIQWIEQHNLTQFDEQALQAAFDVGRVVCVGLPNHWMTALVQKTFWRLESEPKFCDATVSDIQQAIYSSLES